MPGLRLLGRRWNVSSDDFPLQATCGTVYHTAWVLVLVFVYNHTASTGGCQGDPWLQGAPGTAGGEASGPTDISWADLDQIPSKFPYKTTDPSL